MTDEDKRQAKRLIINEGSSHTLISSPSTNSHDHQLSIAASNVSSSSTSTSTSRTKLKLFREKCGLSSEPRPATKQISSIKQEVSRFESIELDAYEDFSSFWRQNCSILPNLSNMARRYACLPATSVPSESSFSVAGYLVRKTRMSLTPKNLKYSMFLKDKLWRRKVTFSSRGSVLAPSTFPLPFSLCSFLTNKFFLLSFALSFIYAFNMFSSSSFNKHTRK